MKLTNLITSENNVLEILNADYIEGHQIRISFSDGKKVIVDFYPFLSASKHPEMRKYLDIDKFRKFKIQDGNLNWNEYDLIFPLEDLYKNNLLNRVKMAY